MAEPSPRLCIAFLTHEPFFPPSGGGSAEAVYLVREMAARGHDVHVFCPQIADADQVEKDFGIQLHLFSRWEMGRYAKGRNLKYLAYPFFLERMVAAAARVIQFDLVVSQHAISAVAAGKLKRRLRIPVMMNFPDLLTGFMETWPPYIAPRPLVRALERYETSLPRRYNVDAVLAISDALADHIAKTGYPSEKICPIYYGYDAEHFPFRATVPGDNRAPVIAMHGSFDAHHLGEIAFRAIERVAERRPQAVFRFIGKRTPGLESLLNRAGREVPGFKFEATGFVPYAEVAGHLQTATVGMVPYEESTGTHCAFVAKVVEYVALGLPSVCTPLESVRRYFQNDPMVRFSAFAGNDFGDKIVSWLDEPPTNWQVAAARSAARVRTELDWQALCRKAVGFIERAYANARCRSAS
ncbi:MAG TPA: glycosyltransferase family 4 protein [Verrucomicrobiae bacterium]|nr:glycosyltransferase family 4 protein [Verrucomicrobiae bacterium]